MSTSTVTMGPGWALLIRLAGLASWPTSFVGGTGTLVPSATFSGWSWVGPRKNDHPR